jgi:SUMO ligase MMS21 Smc5/6 complex component
VRHVVEKLPRLVECVEQMARMDAESKARGRVCGSIRHLLVRERNNNEDPVNEVEEYQRQIEVEQPSWTAQEAAAVEGNRHVKLLRRLVATEENGDDDNVIVQTSGETQRRCPCTCGPLERPVVNKECEHVYSTAGIIGYLYQGNGGRVPKKMEDVNPALTKPCPCAGCTSSVRAAGLERDFRTENSQRHAQRRAETQHGNAVDDDDVEEL